MTIKKLDTTDGFVIYDYPATPASGLVRRGRKILQRSATDLARSATYAFAFHEIKRSGASVGLNAEGEAAEPAVQALLAELAEPLAGGELELLAGKGLRPDELNQSDAGDVGELLSAGVLSAAEWALGHNLDGASVGFEGFDADIPALTGLRDAAAQRGATVVLPDESAKPWEFWGSEVDVLLTGSKPGAMTHQGAEMVKAKAVVPWGPIPITTKALAVLLRSGVTYVPDFVSASGDLIGRHLDAENLGASDQAESFVQHTARRLDATTSEFADESLFVACCLAAERFLDSWYETRPFGRPLAG